MPTIKAYIQLTRPVNLLIAFLSIFMGGFVTGSVHPLLKLLLASLSGTLIAAGANAVNDVYDLDIDRINKPYRPLPSGRVQKQSAAVFSTVLFMLGIAAGACIHPTGLMIALMSSVWLFLYSARLKRTVLWGNFSVAFISGLAFIYGGLAIGRWKQALVVGIFAFFYHFAREIIKDLEDVEGDRADGVVTLPIRHGVRTALFWASGLLALLIGLTFIPYFTGLFNRTYLIIVTAGVDSVLVFVMISMWIRQQPRYWGKLSVIMKADMLVGLIAVWFGSIR